jgi:hypothetical protein
MEKEKNGIVCVVPITVQRKMIDHCSPQSHRHEIVKKYIKKEGNMSMGLIINMYLMNYTNPTL